MRILLFFAFVVVSACASKPRSSGAETQPGTLTLEQALQQGPGPTLSHLKASSSVKALEAPAPRNPASVLPVQLLAERNSSSSKEKSLQQAYLRKFRPWSLEKKASRAEQLIGDFNCGHAIETQALGFSFELDYPEQKASTLSQALHEKVLVCQAFTRQESLFRLSIFSIQKGDCPKAMTYLEQFPGNLERGVNDRIAYLRRLCAPQSVVKTRNPWGGYGILLGNEKKDKEDSFEWKLSSSSGSEEWDRLLLTFIDLHEKGKDDTVQFLATKLNYEKFRELPVGFQASMLVVLNYSGADLPVFQTLHRYLAEHPEMASPAVVGLLFPTRYWPEILENSKKADPVLVKALIRQESAFNPMARSRAKAAGLMQLIYPTAKHFGIRQPKELLSPEANIHAGSEFLAGLIEEFGSVELALAAYNAGPGIVRQWQKRYPTSNIDLFVEMIPYSETREYVRLVRRNYKIYKTILNTPEFKPEEAAMGAFTTSRAE